MVLPNELKDRFLQSFEYEISSKNKSGNPFLVRINSRQFYIYLRNISPAYFKNSPDIIRVQLPYSTKFENISKSVIPLFVFGYDEGEDTFTTWNPKLIKSRLNNKSNVSLYSRKEFSSQLKKKRIFSGYLKTGEQVVTFKRKYIPDFFKEVDKLFNSKNVDLIQKEGYIHEINDKQLLKLISPLLKKRQVLESVEVCAKYYGRKYANMTFSDWFELIQKYLPNE